MNSILDKLKQKVTPVKSVNINIKLATNNSNSPSTQETDKPPVIIKDMRDKGLINRDDILKRLSEKSAVKPVDDTTGKDKTNFEPSSVSQQVAQEDIVETILPVISNIRKTKQKIKIVARKSDIIVSRPSRTTPKPDFEKQDIDDKIVMIDDIAMNDRLHKKSPNVLIKVNSYYQSNREIFINFIRDIFGEYRDKILEDDKKISCDDKDDNFSDLLTHQKIVRDYINIHTPYRGLLLYHGLGSGKTCSSIAIAEGLKSDKQVLIMTPASLRKNYIEELKKCGDSLYKKKQFWEFIKINDNPSYIDTLSKVLGIKKSYITKNGGAWLINSQKESNFHELNTLERDSLDKQINVMIDNKYKFLNYNGIRNKTLAELSNDYDINIFDNKIIVIDEAHNFVSRIVNKLDKPLSLANRLYKFLMEAQNCKIIMLSGTPIINYPNEIAVMFNMLRGFIQTWEFTLDIKTAGIDNKKLKQFFANDKQLKYLVDFIEYTPSSKKLVLTKNPYGYINNYQQKDYEGVKLGQNEIYNITNDKFIGLIKSFLKNNNIEITGQISLNNYKTLPDNKDAFYERFIESDGTVKNIDLFKRRILGLVSYFPDLTQLMPKYDFDTDFTVVNVPMSDYQFEIYEKARVAERKQEKNKAKKKGKDDEVGGTYKIFSRAFCNFVFPEDITRPMPTKDGSADINKVNLDDTTEDIADGTGVQDRIENIDGAYELDDLPELEKKKDQKYDDKIKEALIQLNENAFKYLTPEGLITYGPKLKYTLDNIVDESHKGNHLLYTQFRTIEGIGVFKLVLENNGYVHFKLKKNTADQWTVDIPDEKKNLPKFVLYTGTETIEEKEIIRKVYNGMWNDIPQLVKEFVTELNPNNNMGEVIKLIMITASGAEGISLQNVRYVHILEPYWHPVRLHQVIGRARRICSHKNLPKELQNIKVFLYLMNFNPEQIDPNNELSRELRKFDNSKKLGKPYTSDQLLYEIATIKDDVNKKIIKSIKEASIDCALHSTADSKDKLVCFNFGNPTPDNFSYKPNIDTDTRDSLKGDINKKTLEWKAKIWELPGTGKKYAVKMDTSKSEDKKHELYDLDSYQRGDPILKGFLVMNKGKKAQVVWNKVIKSAV